MGARRDARPGGWFRSSMLLAALLLGNVAAFPLAAAEAPSPSLRVLARYSLSTSPSPATDVRWAGDDSVYLSRYKDGVFEVGLGEELTTLRQIVPEVERFGEFYSFEKLAASRTTLAVASFAWDLSWTAIAKEKDGTRLFRSWPAGLVEDFDVLDRKLLLLGTAKAGEGALAPSAPVAFLGDLEKGPEGLRPLVFDRGRPGRNELDLCAMHALGAVRFLADGSFLVVPGFQPGAYLFDPSGTLVRSWDTRQLGLDSDCSGRKDRKEGIHPEQRLAYANSHRILDDILPLPEGPGLLVRWVEEGRVHWVLEVLGAAGVSTYGVPFTSDHLFESLRGDVRGDRIVLLRSAQRSYVSGGRETAGEILVAQLL